MPSKDASKNAFLLGFCSKDAKNATFLQGARFVVVVGMFGTISGSTSLAADRGGPR